MDKNYGNMDGTAKESTEAAAIGIETHQNKANISSGIGVNNSDIEEVEGKRNGFL